MSAALDAILDELADRIAARLRPPEPPHYSRDRLPPGAASWRAVLEAGRRGELEIVRVGRCAVIAREEWDRYVASRRRGRAGPVAVEDADARALASMGVVLPMRASR
jgi:hypothetical protein